MPKPLSVYTPLLSCNHSVVPEHCFFIWTNPIFFCKFCTRSLAQALTLAVSSSHPRFPGPVTWDVPFPLHDHHIQKNKKKFVTWVHITAAPPTRRPVPPPRQRQPPAAPPVAGDGACGGAAAAQQRVAPLGQGRPPARPGRGPPRGHRRPGLAPSCTPRCTPARARLTTCRARRLLASGRAGREDGAPAAGGSRQEPRAAPAPAGRGMPVAAGAGRREAGPDLVSGPGPPACALLRAAHVPCDTASLGRGDHA